MRLCGVASLGFALLFSLLPISCCGNESCTDYTEILLQPPAGGWVQGAYLAKFVERGVESRCFFSLKTQLGEELSRSPGCSIPIHGSHLDFKIHFSRKIEPFLVEIMLDENIILSRSASPEYEDAGQCGRCETAQVKLSATIP